MSIKNSKTNIQLTIAPAHGFSLPRGYNWNPTIVNGKKEGKVEVFTEEGMLYAELFYHEGKLEGECSFFEEGSIKEKVMYKNDVLNGWSRFYKNGKEDVVYLYENGERVKKLVRENELYREVDLNNEGNYEMGHYDENRNRDGLFYKVENNVLKEENEYKNGVFVRKTKDFVKNEMIEYNENGDKIYQGGYMRNSSYQYVRTGKGKEYEENKVVYVGDWLNSEKDGDGKSMKNGRVYYDGKWKKNVPDGYGKLMNEDGSVKVEGKWERGYIQLKDKYFCYETEETGSGIVGIKWIWSEVIIGMVYLFGSIIASFKSYDSEDIYLIFAYPGLFYFGCAFLHQFNNKCCRVLSIIALIAYCITTITLVINFIGDAWRCTHGIFQYFIFVLLCILYFYLPISSIAILRCQSKSSFAYKSNMFTLIRKKNVYGCILLEIALGITMIIECIVYFWVCSQSYTTGTLCCCGLFLILNGLMFFIISYLQAHDGKLFEYGVWMGVIWGIFSFIVCIAITVYLGNGYSYYAYSNCYYFYYKAGYVSKYDCERIQRKVDEFVVYYAVVCFYTWIIIPLSKILYSNNQPSKKLPIKPSSSV